MKTRLIMGAIPKLYFQEDLKIDNKKIILETKNGEKVELNVQKEAWYKRAWKKTKSTTRL